MKSEEILNTRIKELQRSVDETTLLLMAFEEGRVTVFYGLSEILKQLVQDIASLKTLL